MDEEEYDGDGAYADDEPQLDEVRYRAGCRRWGVRAHSRCVNACVLA